MIVSILGIRNAEGKTFSGLTEVRVLVSQALGFVDLETWPKTKPQPPNLKLISLNFLNP